MNGSVLYAVPCSLFALGGVYRVYRVYDVYGVYYGSGDWKE